MNVRDLVYRLVPMSVLIGLLAGCGHSPPTRFFALEATAPDRPAWRTAGERAPRPVQLDAVRIPALLDRPEIVEDRGDGRVHVHADDRWGAPFAKLVRSTLALDLRARLPAGLCVPPDTPSPADARHVVVTIVALHARAAQAGRQLTMKASWALVDDAGAARVVVSHDVDIDTPLDGDGDGGDDGEAQAAAISRALGTLADRIVAGLDAS